MTDKKTPEERVADYRERNTASAAGITEAPGIAFCTVYMDGLPVNLTARSMTPYDALASLKVSIILAEDFLGVTRTKDIPQAAPPIMQQMKPETAAAFKTVMSKKDPVDEAFPEPVYEDVKGETEVTHANSIKILPHPDDRVNLEFYEDGKKWPVIKVTKWKTKQVQELLEKVTSEDVSKPAEVKVDCAVLWTQGSEYNYNGKTGFYKDVCGVEPA